MNCCFFQGEAGPRGPPGQAGSQVSFLQLSKNTRLDVWTYLQVSKLKWFYLTTLVQGPSGGQGIPGEAGEPGLMVGTLLLPNFNFIRIKCVWRSNLVTKPVMLELSQTNLYWTCQKLWHFLVFVCPQGEPGHRGPDGPPGKAGPDVSETYMHLFLLASVLSLALDISHYH